MTSCIKSFYFFDVVTDGDTTLVVVPGSDGVARIYCCPMILKRMLHAREATFLLPLLRTVSITACRYLFDLDFAFVLVLVAAHHFHG